MKKYLLFPAFAILALCSILLFFLYRMGSNDTRALADFPAAYRNYDQAILDYSRAVLTAGTEGVLATADLEHKANQALVVLNAKASIRISSLTKHDGDLMEVSREIAGLARQELETLKAYSTAASGKSAEVEQLSKQFQDLSGQRQADYTRYLQLAGIKN